MKIRSVLIIILLIVGPGCGSGSDNNADTSANTASSLEATADTVFPVHLSNLNGTGSTTIWIPKGRPVYALLVSGFHQNRNLDMFHFYNFAKCVLEKGGYVHYAWWNNLLAPYMENPLHDDDSVPSTEIVPYHDMWGQYNWFTWWPKPYPDKAIPAEDYQFQADARELLTTIREHNAQAAIILVGHSMGGDAVVRLADNMPADFDIDLLAPIDPVGNRTCMPTDPPSGNFLTHCSGDHHFKRYYAVRNDWWFFPSKRELGTNIKYLYHRWQNEYQPPFDWLSDELFEHHATHVTSIHQGSTNVQFEAITNLRSGEVVPPPDGPNYLGGLDGHGEIVGFRGVYPNFLPEGKFWLAFESWPLALKAPEYWPSLDIERTFDKEEDRANVRNLRVSLLKSWENDPSYLDTYDWGPTNPEYCMVSGDLCTVLQAEVNLQPSADAGPDQIVECSGPDGTPVTLDGSDSFDPNDDLLSFTWTGPFGILTGDVISTEFPQGTHTITLTVDDGRGKTDSDTVTVTVTDSAAPAISLSLSPDILWPPNHKMVDIAASIQVSDTCDDNPVVELVSISSSEADNGLGDGDTSDDIQGASYGTDDRTFSLRSERAGSGTGRVYTINYGAADISGNVTNATAEVTVFHDRGK